MPLSSLVVGPGYSREKKLEEDFALTPSEDRLPNKFLYAKFKSHNKRVGLAIVC